MTGTPTPMRSASGSLAMTRSAPIFLASAIAASRVRGYSGFATWSGTLGKSPSGLRCDARIETSREPGRLEHASNRRFADAVQRSVDDREVAGMADRLAEDGREIGGIELVQNFHDRSARERLLERHLGYLAIGGRLDALDDAHDRRAERPDRPSVRST